MKGDFSRLTFDPTKHYVGVLHQQGRVWLDSDWNEDVLQRFALLQQELNDVVGRCGFPAPGTAFQLSPSPTDPLHDFQIAAGRCYVNGILCQLDASTTYLAQPDLIDPPAIPIPTDGSTLNALVYLEVWQRLITYLEDDGIREIALGGPDTAARLKTVVQVKAAQLPISIAGLTCANVAQFLPTPGNGTLTTLQPAGSQPPDPCRLPDPANFSGRENHLYRVQIHDGGDVAGSILGVTRPVATFKWSRDNAAFGVRVTAVQNDRVTLALSSLGRDQATALRQGDLVEISDDASELGPARGHLTHLATDPDPDQFTVVITDPLPLSFSVPGGTGATSPPSGSLPGLQADRHLILRRWDGSGNASALYSDTSTPDMNLGDGVHIQFNGSDLRSGDYWQFAARSADGSIEMLTNAPPRGIARYFCPLGIVSWGPPPPTSPPASPPGGIAMTVLEDCRAVFPPLIDFPRPDGGVHVTGLFTVDPVSGFQSPLFNDTSVPVTALAGGIQIQCDGAIDPASISRPTCFLSVEVPFGPAQKDKDKEKEKEKEKEKDKEKEKEKDKDKEKEHLKEKDKEFIKEKDKEKEKEKEKDKEKEHIKEKDIKEGDKVADVIRQPFVFAALRVPAPTPTVKTTLKSFEKAKDAEKLPEVKGTDKTTEKVKELEKTKEAEKLPEVKGTDKTSEKVKELEKTKEAEKLPDKVKDTDKIPDKTKEIEKVVEKVLEKVHEKIKEIEVVPQSPPSVGPPPAGLATGAYQPIVLAANVSATANVISWNPSVDSANFLLQLPSLTPADDIGILARLTLKGNFIWALNDPTVYLDGEAFGSRQAGVLNTSLTLPSGDRRRGGDFEMWFWLVSPQVVLAALQVSPSPISIADTANLTVILSGPAPQPGVLVKILNSNPTVASGAVHGSPPSITVPAGSTSASFKITGLALGQTTFTASLQDGGVTLAATLTVVQPSLTGGLSLVPNPIFVGRTSIATLTLSGPAPAAGTTVAITTDNPSVAGVPATVAVPPGSATTAFPITTLAVGQATITATLAGVSVAATLFVREKLKDKEFIKEGEKLTDKIQEVVGFGSLSGGLGGPISATALARLPQDAVHPARAFIRPQERPEVGQAGIGAVKTEKEA